MFSRSNGPASFAMNLFLDKSIKYKFDFFTTDVKSSFDNVKRVNSPFKGMIMYSFCFYLKLRKIKCKAAIWNFSVLSFFSILFLKKTDHIVFVNDSLSLNIKLSLSYKSFRLFIFRFLERYTVINSKKVIVNSEYIKNQLVNQYKINPNKIEVLFKGLNLSEITKYKTDFDIDIKKPIRVTFVKSDPEVGGLELLCNSLSLLNYNFELKIIGPKILNKKYFKHQNIKINLLGKLKKNILYNNILKSDLFFVPCLDEAFGQANIEAMYCKIPTLLLPIDQQKLIHNESYCYFSDGITKLKISESIHKLINLKTEERKTSSNLAHQIIRDKFSFESTKINFKKILDENI